MFTAVVVSVALYYAGAVPQVDEVDAVCPVLQQQTAVLTVERVQRHVNRTTELQRAAERPVNAARVLDPYAEIFVERSVIERTGAAVTKRFVKLSHRVYGLYGQARTVSAYGHPKPRLFLLCWHRRDVDPSNAEDDMKPPRSSPAFISRSN